MLFIYPLDPLPRTGVHQLLSQSHTICKDVQKLQMGFHAGTYNYHYGNQNQGYPFSSYQF